MLTGAPSGRDLGAAVEQISATGVTVAGFAADLGMPEQISQLTERVLDRFGRIDILVNNAGATWRAPRRRWSHHGADHRRRWRRDDHLRS